MVSQESCDKSKQKNLDQITSSNHFIGNFIRFLMYLPVLKANYVKSELACIASIALPDPKLHSGPFVKLKGKMVDKKRMQ